MKVLYMDEKNRFNYLDADDIFVAELQLDHDGNPCLWCLKAINDDEVYCLKEFDDLNEANATLVGILVCNEHQAWGWIDKTTSKISSHIYDGSGSLNEYIDIFNGNEKRCD